MSAASRWSVTVWTVNPPRRTPAALRAANVRSIEAGPGFVLDRSPADMRALAGDCRDAGIELRSIHAPFDEPARLAHADDAVRLGAVATHRDVIERGAECGFRIVVVHPGPSIDAADREAGWERARASISALTPVVEDAGVVIAVENMLPGMLGDDWRELRAFIESFDSPAVRGCLDIGHAHVHGDCVDAWITMAPVLANVHVHDNDGTRDMHLQPPYGTVPWPALVDAMRDHPFADALTLETAPWRWAGDSYAWMLRETTALFANGGRPATAPGPDGVPCALTCLQCGHRVFTDAANTTFCRCAAAPSE